MNSSSPTARSATRSPSSTRWATTCPSSRCSPSKPSASRRRTSNDVVASRYFMGGKAMRLGEMIDRLQRIYTGKIGAEFMHIQPPQVRNWVRDRIEAWPDTPAPEPAAQRNILGRLLAAEAFERFLHTRYVGQKRFSLEGGETLLPLLETILERCPHLGIREIVMGMAHRGRLNVLANFLKKSVRMIFTEFSENYQPNLVNGDGDVKYHLGYESDRDRRRRREVERAPGVQPEPPGVRRPGRGRQGARPPAHPGGHRRAQARAAAAHPRRRGVHRAGHRRRDAQHVPAARLPHGRHGPCHHQQPDRLHHAAGRRAFSSLLLHGRGQDDRQPRFSTSTATTRRRSASWRRWRRISGRSSGAMSSSTCTATAATATTRATSRASPSPTSTRRSASSPASPRSTATSSPAEGRVSADDAAALLKEYEAACETALRRGQGRRRPASSRARKKNFAGSTRHLPAAVFARADATRRSRRSAGKASRAPSRTCRTTSTSSPSSSATCSTGG